MACELCDSDGGTVLWSDAALRIVRIDDPDHPAFCRVVWNAHVREMTDLPEVQRQHFMQAVFLCETALRELLHPHKINLASLGNQTPHLHWHVIPRFTDDRHFPRPVWAEPTRDAGAQQRGVPDVLLKDRLAQLFAPAATQG